MKSLLHLKIVTPEKTVYDEAELDSVSIPTETGEITILPGHIPIVTTVVEGELVTRKKNDEESLVITKGFLKYDQSGEILLLSDYAIRSRDVEIAKLEEAKKKAQEAMREKKSEVDFKIAEAQLRRTLLELKVSQKRKTKS